MTYSAAIVNVAVYYFIGHRSSKMPRRCITNAQVLQDVLSSDEENVHGNNYGHDSDLSSEHSSVNGDFCHVDSATSNVSDDDNLDLAPVGRGCGRGRGSW